MPQSIPPVNKGAEKPEEGSVGNNDAVASAWVRAAGVEEKPRNGMAGLKHWRYDLRSGFMVAMISLPFSMGIAMASGAPPICGITSAIIAGLVLPFLGGSYVTISGPAAGLAPVIFAGMMLLGTTRLGAGASSADALRVGYPLILVAICVAGALQMVLAKFKVARLSAIFPASAIEGMLAAIGLMIIVKQIPLFMGRHFESYEFWEMLREVPYKIEGMNVQVFGLGMGGLMLLFVLSAVPGRLLKVMPPPVWVFFLGTAVSYLFLDLPKDFLIQVDADILERGLVFPRFGEVAQTPALWLPLAYIVFTLILIDGVESLATIAAVDKIDVFHRRSDPDRTLQAMGVSNMASSVLGGLTIIPGIVKSTANILGGGRTQWANFYNACFLLGFLIFGRGLINLVPKAILASILVFIGFKLCRPKVWRHMAHLGTEQFVIFTVTVLVTVSTDLLVGIAVGVALKLLLCWWYVGLWYHLRGVEERPGALARAANLFRNPVGRRKFEEGDYHLYIDRPMVCFNLFHVIREIANIPPTARHVSLHLTNGVTLLDHTTSELLLYYYEEFSSRDDKPQLDLDGLDKMRPLARHKSSMRMAKLQETTD